ncbi:MAG: hypothetical protein H6Q65_640 [Firmicutes bacterium]|nr:hypothetical protein [Bacillota bacterium]
MDQIETAISLLKKMAGQERVGVEEIEQAISALEAAKDIVGTENEETIDKIDELQDYFDYVLASNRPIDLAEAKQEITALLEALGA